MSKRIMTRPQKEIRKRVISEYKGKASVDELSAKYDLHHKCIKYIIRVYNKPKTWLRKTGSGRPKRKRVR